MAAKPYFLALALAGCAIAASTVAMRFYSRREDARLHKLDLSGWEGDGGKPAASSVRPAQPH